MYTRFEKFSHQDGRHRYLVLSLMPTLLGEWCVSQVRGPLGKPGGNEKRIYCASPAEAHTLYETLRDRQIKRGFVPIPEQMGLF